MWVKIFRTRARCGGNRKVGRDGQWAAGGGGEDDSKKSM